MDDHAISRRVLDRFVHHTATSEEQRAVLRHLLAGCMSCQAYLGRFWPGVSKLGNVVELSNPRYDDAFEKAWSRLRPSTEVLAELDLHPPLRQELIVRNDSRYWRREICEALIDRAQGARFSDTRLMRHSAGLAVLISKQISAVSRRDESAVEDLRTRAWTGLANALRVAGDLNAAEEAFGSAQIHRDRGCGEPSLRASLLSQGSSLRLDQRRFSTCRILIQEATEIWRNLHNRQEVARCLFQEALAVGEGGNPNLALLLLKEAERTVDREADPQLELIIIHSRIRFLADSRQTKKALELHSEMSPLYAQRADRLILIKRTWLKGQLLRAEGHLEPAVHALAKAQQDFIEQGSTYEAALVSLEIAEAVGKLGRRKEMRRLAAAAFREMTARRVRREALAALILLRS